MKKQPLQISGNLLGLVLAVLQDSPLHGYGIAREIEKRSEDALSFGEGNPLSGPEDARGKGVHRGAVGYVVRERSGTKGLRDHARRNERVGARPGGVDRLLQLHQPGY